MPLAGWCRECGEWVWIDSEGGCQHGHGPDCVERVHEQAVSTDPDSDEPDPLESASAAASVASAPALRGFGVGELPDTLNRFNWGAFFLPLFWGATYGSWQVLAVWFVALVSPTALGSLLGGSGGVLGPSAIIGITVASEVLAGLARLWAGANANRLVWRREALRVKVVEGAQARFTVEHFASRQRTWMIWSAVVIGASSVLSVPLTMPVWREYGLTYVGSLMPVAWLLAEVVAGLWLDARMRAEQAEAPPEG